ncbi:hypothetical protein [Salinivibrio sp. SS2]|uniref:hypothetical protein n=1 Tax=Salinivibrio sp. SS2 TaxID=1892894 RepID=UPI00084CE103|nr:hypothetical protein [Salinivibrio sp. DV]ODQ00626.1 hypothetical protein BGK46_06135 [Salinivibrio sp. DV]
MKTNQDPKQTTNMHTTATVEREDGQTCPADVDQNTGEIKQKSAAFYAFNKQNYKKKLQLAIDNPVANSIFEYMVSEMDNTNALCVSMKTLETIFGLKRNALSKHIKYLEKEQFLEIYKLGNMNVYAINAYLVWTQGDANLHKAKFKANVVLNLDEQTTKVKREYAKQVSIK